MAAVKRRMWTIPSIREIPWLLMLILPLLTYGYSGGTDTVLQTGIFQRVFPMIVFPLPWIRHQCVVDLRWIGPSFFSPETSEECIPGPLMARGSKWVWISGSVYPPSGLNILLQSINLTISLFYCTIYPYWLSLHPFSPGSYSPLFCFALPLSLPCHSFYATLWNLFRSPGLTWDVISYRTTTESIQCGQVTSSDQSITQGPWDHDSSIVP